MLLTICKAKIAHATVTDANLYYEGSITIDKELCQAVDILPSEKVEILNLNNGSRIETYVIAQENATGKICLNGPAARWGCVGDKIIILSYALMGKKEAEKFKSKIVYLGEQNKIVKTVA